MTNQKNAKRNNKDAWLPKEHVFAERYKLRRPLGSGGWGQVYLAQDQVLGRQVAVKRLLPSLAVDPEAVARFHREASVVASVKDPNVLTVFDIIQDGDEHLMVMEYADAGTLSQVLRLEGTLDSFEAMGVTIDICKGLRAVHGKGIVHRDIKPANVMFFARNDGFPLAKLGDFGIALQTSDPRTTAGDKVLGTLIFLSPEQAARSEVLTASSDLYSVGVLLYEMLAGELDKPFFLKYLDDQVEQTGTDYFVQFPEPLQPILFRALRQKPEVRFQSAEEMLQALERARGRLTSSLATQYLLEETIAKMRDSTSPPLPGAIAPIPPPSSTQPSATQVSPAPAPSETTAVTRPKPQRVVLNWLLIGLLVVAVVFASSFLSIFMYNKMFGSTLTPSSLIAEAQAALEARATVPPPPTSTATPTNTPSPTATATQTATPPPSPSPTATSTATPPPSPTTRATPTPTKTRRPSATPTATSAKAVASSLTATAQAVATAQIRLDLVFHNSGVFGNEVLQVSSEDKKEVTINYQEQRPMWGEVITTIDSRAYKVDRSDLNNQAVWLPGRFSLEIKASPALLAAIESQSDLDIHPRRGDFWIGHIKCGRATPPDAVKKHTLTVRLLEDNQLRAEKSVIVRIHSNFACIQNRETPRVSIATPDPNPDSNK